MVFRAANPNSFKLCRINDGYIKYRSKEEACYRFNIVRPVMGYNSAYLEGVGCTLPDVYDISFGNVPEGSSTVEVTIVNNLLKTYKMLEDLVLSQENPPSLDVLSDNIHVQMMDKVILDRGIRRYDFSSGGEGYVGLGAEETFVDYEGNKLKEAEGVFNDLLKNATNPLEYALNLLALRTYLQLYVDGNKRTSTALCNYILLMNGLDALSVPAPLKGDYEEALGNMYRSGDQTSFVRFLEKVYRDMYYPKSNFFTF